MLRIVTSSFNKMVQLKRAIDIKAAFEGYEEGPLLFRPTYRYDVGTDNYDTSEKLRIPAWTGKTLNDVIDSCLTHGPRSDTLPRK